MADQTPLRNTLLSPFTTSDKFVATSFITNLTPASEGKEVQNLNFNSCNSRELVIRSKNNWQKVNQFYSDADDLVKQYGITLSDKIEREDDEYLSAYKIELKKLMNNFSGIRDKEISLRKSIKNDKYVRALNIPLKLFKEEAKRLYKDVERQELNRNYLKQRILMLDKQIVAYKKLLNQIIAKKANSKEKSTEPVITKELLITKPTPTIILPRICRTIKYMLKAHIKKPFIIDEVVNYHRMQVKKNKELIAKLQQRLNPTVRRKSKFEDTSQSNLIQYLSRAVEKIKFHIFLRILKGRKLSSKERFTPSLSEMGRLTKYSGKSLKVKLKDFTATDKREVILQFFNNEEVFNAIQEIIKNEKELKSVISSPDAFNNTIGVSPAHSQLLIQVKTQLRNKRRQNVLNKSASPYSIFNSKKMPELPMNQRSKINSSMFTFSLYQ